MADHNADTHFCWPSEDWRLMRGESESERLWWQGCLSLQLSTGPPGLSQNSGGPRLEVGSLLEVLLHTWHRHILSLPSDTHAHSSWGKYIKHLIASYSTWGIILRHICLARTYFVDSWRMIHREKWLRKKEKSKTDLVHFQLAEGDTVLWRAGFFMSVVWYRVRERHTGLISVTLLQPVFKLCREINKSVTCV